MEGLGTVCVVLKKFVNGFIVNRFQRAMGREVFHLLEEDVADPERDRPGGAGQHRHPLASAGRGGPL